MLLFAYSYALDAMASSPKYPDRVDTERPLGTVVFPYNPAAPDAHRAPPTDQVCNALCVVGSMEASGNPSGREVLQLLPQCIGAQT